MGSEETEEHPGLPANIQGYIKDFSALAEAVNKEYAVIKEQYL